jgi:hypothetical protein
VNATLNAVHADGFVVYSPERDLARDKPGKLWCASPSVVSEEFTRLIIATAADAGVALRVDSTWVGIEEHPDWTKTTFAIDSTARNATATKSSRPPKAQKQ